MVQSSPHIKEEELDDPSLPPISASDSLASPANPRIKSEPGEWGAEGPSLASGTGIAQGRKRPATQVAEGCTDDVKPPAKKRGRSKKEPPPPIYKVLAKRVEGTSDIPGVLDIDDSVLAKIKKCFGRAEHNNASEAEARAAVFLAGKLMRQYNVNRTEVMAYRTPEEQAQCAGESEVVIKRCDEAKTPIPIRQWASDLARAMSIFFDVKTYSSTPTDRSRVSWVFYGIAQNTASAALAFEKVYNLILDWARFKKGIAKTNSYCLGIAYQLLDDTKKEKVEEMEKAKKAEAEELIKREGEEQLQLEKELGRLQPTVEAEPEPEPESRPEPAEEETLGDARDLETEDINPEEDQEGCVDIDDALSDREGSDMTHPSWLWANSNEDKINSDDGQPDFVNDDEDTENQQFDDTDKAIDALAKTANERTSGPTPPASGHQSSPEPVLQPPKPVTPVREVSPELDPQWKSAMQLTIFRETASKVAEEYLKEKGMKLKTARRGAKPKDREAFTEGQRDGKKIDVHQKALGDKEQNIKEENDD